MTAARLSPAQRNALYAVCLGGLRNRQALPTKAVQTLDVLRAKGMLDADYQPTDAGRAVFEPLLRRNVQYAVWHLIGPQACGKSTFAAAAERAVADHGGQALWLDVHTLDRVYGGNPERVLDEYPGLTVLMVEDNAERPAPRHYMQGDTVIDLGGYTTSVQRRPQIGLLVARALLQNPTWSGQQAMLHVKLHYDQLAAVLKAAEPTQREASHA